MELSKQAPAVASSQRASRGKPSSDKTGARVPIGEYLIVPISGQAGAPRPTSAAHFSSRVLLRPPPHLMSVHAASPGIFGSQPSPSATGKEMDAASAEAQMPKLVLNKCSVQKEPLQKTPQESCESVRAKLGDSLAAVLGMDSDHLSEQQSASNVVRASESTPKLNSERDFAYDIDAGATVSLNEPEPKRQKTSDEVITGETTEDKAAALSEFEFTCDAPSPKEKCRSKIESPKNVSVPSLCRAKPKGDMLIKASSKMLTYEKLDTGGSCGVSIPGDTMHSNATPDAALTHGSLWEGTIQFTLTSLTNVAAIFISGEKPSTNDWRRFVEIEGRVKLTDFQEFLEQLPNSRRRAVMVTELRWKEDSLESGRHHLLQTIDSYIADERVGLVKPATGVKLYLCPPHGKAAQILAKQLPKEHFDSSTVTGEASIIGVVVWQRPDGPTRIPTGHDGSDCFSMPISRKQQAVIASSVPMPSQLTKAHGSHFIQSNEHRRLHDDDDVSDAVPPGSGQCDVKHDANLPEYNFVGASTSQTSRRQQHVPEISHPSDQVRQLVHKYGDRDVSAQPWDGNDDSLRSPDQMRHLVHKYNRRYVSVRPWDENNNELRSPDQMRQLVRKYGNSYVSPQPWDGKDNDLRSPDQLRQLVHKYRNSYVSAQSWAGNNDDLRPPGQARQLVHRYDNRYSGHPWYGKDDYLPEPYWDPIQSGHQRTRHPQPLLSLTERDRQRDRYYDRHHQLQEHYDEMLLQRQRAMAAPQLINPMPQVYVGPEQHVMTVQQRRRRHFQSVMHPAEC